ncbi:MAG TPA: hypothetical protein VGO58_15525 [Chitinophagaceae bacterium]|jgi:hypothetical protein|nr:hypothetical protein [Chitinophagaceae bacterium]
MGLFDRFKKNKELPFSRGSYFHTAINDDDLHTLINQAIDVFERNEHADTETIILSIYRIYPDKNLAIALYRFIPTAFCRLFFYQVNYSDEYIVASKGKEPQEFHYSDDGIYNMVAMISKQRIIQSARPEATFNVLFHSADFNAINKAVKDGAELENLSCFPSYFAKTV